MLIASIVPGERVQLEHCLWHLGQCLISCPPWDDHGIGRLARQIAESLWMHSQSQRHPRHIAENLWMHSRVFFRKKFQEGGGGGN